MNKGWELPSARRGWTERQAGGEATGIECQGAGLSRFCWYVGAPEKLSGDQGRRQKGLDVRGYGGELQALQKLQDRQLRAWTMVWVCRGSTLFLPLP